ncbi:MAG: SBBP repeat-containing protein, partial [Acidobacteria bacterium]|nr:SBBP repeat-containing protein [Acidobacteriota bacterium]
MSPNIGTGVSVAFLWVWLGGFSGLLFLPNTAHSQTIEWIRQFGSTSNDWANRVAVDTSGVYVAGLTNGALPGQTSAGLEDAFLRKYEDSGNELWTRQFGSESSDVALGVAVNATDVYVVAYTKDTLLGGTVGRDAFVGKYDTNGNESWTRPFGSTSYDEAWGVAVDATGVYVAGITGGALPG